VGHVVGVTGPPGVGKSTLLAGLIRTERAAGRTVGAIVVDPSSRRSGGALLGDRMRLGLDDDDPGVFVRSMAARERLGGLAALTFPAVVLMRALFDRVFVETVGVGQSETDIGALADTVVLCIQPGSGDTMQYMKAGIAEIPDIAVVTKADLGALAEKARGDLETALALDRPVPVVMVAAEADRGLAELGTAIESHGRAIRGELAPRRARQAASWLEDAVREAFGREGLERARALPDGLAIGPEAAAFRRFAELAAALRGP
jgi:LAO/AO transport system kinase